VKLVQNTLVTDTVFHYGHVSRTVLNLSQFCLKIALKKQGKRMRRYKMLKLVKCDRFDNIVITEVTMFLDVTGVTALKLRTLCVSLLSLLQYKQHFTKQTYIFFVIMFLLKWLCVKNLLKFIANLHAYLIFLFFQCSYKT
jgi:hypothetical protein